MSFTDTQQGRPRIGIPWRTSADEANANSTGERGKTQDYLNAVENAGAEAVLLPLKDSEERNRLMPTLDAFVLPGSPADVEPSRYGAVNRGLSAAADLAREETDRAVLGQPAFHRVVEQRPRHGRDAVAGADAGRQRQPPADLAAGVPRDRRRAAAGAQHLERAGGEPRRGRSQRR